MPLIFWKVDSSRFAAAIEDIKFQLKVCFCKQMVSVCRRSANSIANELARIGRICLPNDSMCRYSIIPLPPQVVVCAFSDMTCRC